MPEEKPDFWDETKKLVNFFFQKNRPFSETAVKMQSFTEEITFDPVLFWKYVKQFEALGAIERQKFDNNQLESDGELKIVNQGLQEFQMTVQFSKKQSPFAFQRTRTFWKVFFPIRGTLKEHLRRFKKMVKYTPMDTFLWRKEENK